MKWVRHAVDAASIWIGAKIFGVVLSYGVYRYRRNKWEREERERISKREGDRN